MKPNPEIRVLAALIAHQLRGGPVTKDSLYECLEAVDELVEFETVWLAAKHSPPGKTVVEERDAAWLDGAAEKLASKV